MSWVLCWADFIIPSAFMFLVMSVSALLMVIISSVVSVVSLQFIIWLLLSIGFVVLIKLGALFRKRRNSFDSMMAITLTIIPTKSTGRVLYQDHSWNARCLEESLAIAANQKVYVVGREETTLIILPDIFF